MSDFFFFKFFSSIQQSVYIRENMIVHFSMQKKTVFLFKHSLVQKGGGGARNPLESEIPEVKNCEVTMSRSPCARKGPTRLCNGRSSPWPVLLRDQGSDPPR